MSGKKNIAVFIQEMKGNEWLGGKNYYDNLRSLVSARFPEVKFIEYDFLALLPVSKPGILARVKGKISGKPAGVTPSRLKSLQEIAPGSEIVVFSGHPITGLTEIPFIFWIPDFQFMHLSEIATDKYETAFRNKLKRGIQSSTLVMLSSNDGLKDLEKFSPGNSEKTVIIPFAKKIKPEFLETGTASVVKKYNLPDRFFFLPNQFWKHKNHRLVLEALAILKKKGNCPFVVFSGNTHDFRNPGHFDELLKFVSVNDLRADVAFLGVIPFEDVISLFRHSIAVINPSLFEGWSTTVEEGKSIGKKMLVSDLAVHKEQDPAGAVFFSPDDAIGLAGKMETLFAGGSQNAPDERKALQEYSKNEETFAVKFRELLDTAMDRVKKNAD